MVAHIHFSKIRQTVFTFALGLLVGCISLNTFGKEREISELAKEGLEIMNRVKAGDISVFPELNGIIEEANDADIDSDFMMDQAPEWLKKQYDLIDESEQEGIYLFASRSMPELELVEMMREASGNPKAVVVFRGIYPNENFKEAFSDIQRIIDKARLDAPPKVEIDPVKFRTFRVLEAPEIVYAKGDEAIIRARGTFSIDWLMQELEFNGRRGDIGSYGTVNMITEVDLVEMMKERLAKIDLEKKKTEVISNYWKEKSFLSITKATENSKRKVEPTLVVSQNILSSDGSVVAKAGDRINPLFLMPFTYKLIIFDANDEEQVQFVENKLDEFSENQLVQLIATNINSEDGWKHLNSLDNKLGYPVYILNKEVQQRFGIGRVPSVVDADDRYFYIEEFDVRGIETESRSIKASNSQNKETSES